MDSASEPCVFNVADKHLRYCQSRTTTTIQSYRECCATCLPACVRARKRNGPAL